MHFNLFKDSAAVCVQHAVSKAVLIKSEAGVCGIQSDKHMGVAYFRVGSDHIPTSSGTVCSGMYHNTSTAH